MRMFPIDRRSMQRVPPPHYLEATPLPLVTTHLWPGWVSVCAIVMSPGPSAHSWPVRRSS